MSSGHSFAVLPEAHFLVGALVNVAVVSLAVGKRGSDVWRFQKKSGKKSPLWTGELDTIPSQHLGTGKKRWG